MKFIKLAVLTWVVAVAILFGLFEKITPPVTTVKTFCAYGKLFVEFEEGSHKWGSMMLNWDGKPIHCTEENETTLRQETYNIQKETI